MSHSYLDKEIYDKRPHVTGRAKYLDDVKIAGICYVAILRSPYAHARIKNIDSSIAVSNPKVKAIFTGDVVSKFCNSLGILVEANPPDSRVAPKFPLAVDRVRYVGEAVAAVVAEDPYSANDALEDIKVEYEPLPVVIDPFQASQNGSTLLYDSFGTNIAFRHEIRTGDVENAFREADDVLRDTFRIQRVAGVAMETRGVIATFDEAIGYLTVWSASHRPHALRTSLAEILGHPENRIRVITPAVGGSFGSKTNTYAEEVLLALIAIQLKRPVKWVSTRSEDFVSATHGRDAFADVEVAFKRSGEVLALRAKVVANIGAYWQRLAHAPAINMAKFLPGCYRIENLEAEVLGVYTNKMATHVLRGTGRPEAAFVIEKIMDRVASKLGLDPVDVRRKNFIPSAKLPYRNAGGLLYDSGDYNGALEKALKVAAYHELREQQRKLRESGRIVGIGVSSYIEASSIAGGWEYVEVRTEPTGKFTILSGISSHGQSTDSVLKQVFASEMGISPTDVEVITGDTAVVPYGWGSIASRSLATAGSGVVMAANELKEKLIDVASILLEASKRDLIYDSGQVKVKGVPNASLTVKDIAQSVYAHHGISERAREITRPLNVVELPQVEASFPYGTHVCMAEVDKETGKVSILKYIAVDDCGTIINEKLVYDQTIGSIVYGLSEACLEEIIYDSDGNMLTSTLMDYLVATAVESPTEIVADNTQVPARNLLGAKGSAESGTVAAISVISNALEDALSPFGAKFSSFPLSSEAVYKALRSSEKKVGGG